MLIPGLAIADTLPLVGVAAALGRKFYSTRDRVFLWLIGALVVWPLVQLGLFFGYSRFVDTVPTFRSLSSGELPSVALYTLDLIERSLLIVATLMLYRGSEIFKRKNEGTAIQLDPSPELST